MAFWEDIVIKRLVMPKHADSIRWCDHSYEVRGIKPLFIITVLQSTTSLTQRLHQHHCHISKMDLISKIHQNRHNIIDNVWNNKVLSVISLEIVFYFAFEIKLLFFGEPAGSPTRISILILHLGKYLIQNGNRRDCVYPLLIWFLLGSCIL